MLVNPLDTAQKIEAMSYYKAVFDFDRAIEEKAPEERDIHTKMSVLPLFNTPPIPYPDFLLAINAQQTAVDNAQNGGKIEVALMHTKEGIVDDMVRKYRDYVSEVADGDTDIILSAGFRHTKTRASVGDMPKVEGVKNLRTELSGTLKLKWKAEKNVAFYEVQVREEESEKPAPIPGPTPGPGSGDPTIPVVIEEREWLVMSTKPARIEITGLEPLRRYEVRVRAKGTAGFGAFSDVVIMVVT